jgi:hypothetical protein
MRPKVEQEPVGQRLGPVQRVHSWSSEGKAWRCAVCLSAATSDAYKRSRTSQRCPGPAQVLRNILEANGGHTLSGCTMSGSGRQLFACTACGAFATTLPRNLAEPCHRSRSSRGKETMARLAKGVHPTASKNGVEQILVSELTHIDIYACGVWCEDKPAVTANSRRSGPGNIDHIRSAAGSRSGWQSGTGVGTAETRRTSLDDDSESVRPRSGTRAQAPLLAPQLGARTPGQVPTSQAAAAVETRRELSVGATGSESQPSDLGRAAELNVPILERIEAAALPCVDSSVWLLAPPVPLRALGESADRRRADMPRSSKTSGHVGQEGHERGPARTEASCAARGEALTDRGGDVVERISAERVLWAFPPLKVPRLSSAVCDMQGRELSGGTGSSGDHAAQAAVLGRQAVPLYRTAFECSFDDAEAEGTEDFGGLEEVAWLEPPIVASEGLVRALLPIPALRPPAAKAKVAARKKGIAASPPKLQCIYGPPPRLSGFGRPSDSADV